MDMWARFQRLIGNECIQICADDTHGTPVMLAAQKKGISPEEHIAQIFKEHQRDLKDFKIEYTHYSSTHSQENRELCEYFFRKMQSKKVVRLQEIEQLYCPHDKMFLPDRFVKGDCPKCGAKDQYGDSCDKCGATYQPKDLHTPQCAVCGTTPILKTSEHILFQLNKFREMLKEWLPQHTAPEVSAKMMEWFHEDLRDWDITRDAPYFGFEIPGYPGKYFYVWVDAPMGYLSTLEQYLKSKGQKLHEFIHQENLEIVHTIGKDIVYFHTLFWPALLNAADFPLPTRVQVHGHLTVQGEKMSKSKGTQINARRYLDHGDAEHLRYYFASKMNSGVDDFDFSDEDFTLKVNAELIGKFVNLGSRSIQMLHKSFAGVQIKNLDRDGIQLLQTIQSNFPMVQAHFQQWNFAKGIAVLRGLAEDCNRYFDTKSPWKIIKTHPEEAHQVLTTTAQAFRLLMIGLAPILPEMTKRVRAIFNESSWSWDSVSSFNFSNLNQFDHLSQRVELEKVRLMFDSNAPTGSTTPNAPKNPQGPGTDRCPPLATEIEIGEFVKTDLRVARIIEAQHVAGADKLLGLKVDLGPLGERQIFAGIKSAYAPESLVGRLTVVVANLKARQMKFGLSQGMVLAAGPGAQELFILSPDSGAQPGDKVK